MRSKSKKRVSPHEKQARSCPEMNRRHFLKATGATLATAALNFGPAACSSTPEVLPAAYVPSGTATVGIVGGGDIEKMVRDAISLAGGLNDITNGQTVVIKPNITAKGSRPIYTHPEVIRAVIRAVGDRTDRSNITVAEASAYGLPTQFWAERMGLLDIIEEEGANFLAWEKGEYVTVPSPSYVHLRFNPRMPKTLMDGSVDHLVNVPILKNHETVPWANVEYTACIKNHVGTLHPGDRLFTSEGIMGIHTEDLGEICAELNLAIPSQPMNVVDALSVILTGGPASISMEMDEPGLILASKDRVGCDSAAVAVLKHYAIENGIDRPYVERSVWDQAQIRRAQELNLGRPKEQIEIAHQGVENISDILGQWV